MELASPTVVKQGNNLHVSHGDDKGLFVEFSLEALEDEELTAKEGRPIFKEVEMITIRIVGDTKTVVKRPVDQIGTGGAPPDPVRFPYQWQVFKSKNEVPLQGTPITEWPPVSKALALELKAMNIHTVESLAECSDGNLKWMGARDLREKAIAWLQQAKDGSGIVSLQEEITQLKMQNEALKNQIEGLAKAAKSKPKE